MSGQSDGLKMILDEFDHGWVYCKGARCAGRLQGGHCPSCGGETMSRLLAHHVEGSPDKLPEMVISGGGEVAYPWLVALEIMGSLDTVDGGGKAYSLRERREARREVKKRGMIAGSREMAFSMIDGLLIGHAKGASDGQKHTMDKAKRSIGKP